LPIKAINRPRSIGVISPFLAPSRDGRGHQWQAPPLGAHSPPLAFLPLALFKPVLERLRLPLPSQHTHSPTRAPIHQRRRLGFPPPRVPAAVVHSSPLVNDHLRRLSFLLFGFTRGSSSSIGCRFSSPEPVGAVIQSHRSAARSALLPSFTAVASSSPSSSPATPLNCEQ
jgi:hypothetical protein